MISINYVEINQPIGVIYYTKMMSNNILSLTKFNRALFEVSQNDTNDGYQREPSSERIKNIALYCNDPDASFPTPIIISANSNSVEFNYEKNTITIKEDSEFGEIIDGQHRLLGIQKSEIIFELPVVIMFDLTKEEKAYIFSTINSNQVKVPTSRIYNLYGLSKKRSPYKTCHEIARALNRDENSAFYQRLKMLGKKTHEQSTISQGTFVKELLKLISSNPQEDEIDLKNGETIAGLKAINYPLRAFFINEKDNMIYKIMMNCFNALADVFEDEWNEPDDYILSKTIGYTGIMRSLKSLIYYGMRKKNLNYEFFENIFTKFKNYLKDNNLELTSSDFSSSSKNASQLSKMILYSNKIILVDPLKKKDTKSKQFTLFDKK